MKSNKSDLPDIMRQLVADIVHPDVHYMVSANYFDFLDLARSHTRRYMNPIYVHQDSAASADRWNIDLDEDGLFLDVLLIPDPAAAHDRIYIPYNQIYAVARNQTGGIFDADDLIYANQSVMRMPPVS